MFLHGWLRSGYTSIVSNIVFVELDVTVECKGMITTCVDQVASG